MKHIIISTDTHRDIIMNTSFKPEVLNGNHCFVDAEKTILQGVHRADDFVIYSANLDEYGNAKSYSKIWVSRADIERMYETMHSIEKQMKTMPLSDYETQHGLPF